MREFLRRTWAEIHLDRIRYNQENIRAIVGPECKVMGIVKADAYGHGDVPVAAAMLDAGVDELAVSNIEEAISLRRGGIKAPILILGITPPALAKNLAELSITQAVFCKEYAEELSAEARKAGVTLQVHLKIDTGMTRIGYRAWPDQLEETIADTRRVLEDPAFHVTGVFTHFAVSDEKKEESIAYTKTQFVNFKNYTDAMEGLGYDLGTRHCCNSAATVNYPEMHLDMVRPGVIAYGMPPSDELLKSIVLKPVMELKTTVAMLKTIEAGTTVSYGRIFTAPKEMRIATVPIGYADGYPRALSNRACMLIHGKRAPVIGRVCMDQLMLDVTDIEEVKTGDVVTVFGADGGQCILADEIAKESGTINYEIVCQVSKRVPRIYLDQWGETVDVIDHICPNEIKEYTV